MDVNKTYGGTADISDSDDADDLLAEFYFDANSDGTRKESSSPKDGRTASARNGHNMPGSQGISKSTVSRSTERTDANSSVEPERHSVQNFGTTSRRNNSSITLSEAPPGHDARRSSTPEHERILKSLPPLESLRESVSDNLPLESRLLNILVNSRKLTRARKKMQETYHERLVCLFFMGRVARSVQLAIRANLKICQSQNDRKKSKYSIARNKFGF